MSTSIFTIPDEYISRHFEEKTPLPDYRTAFMRDRDRILYSTAIRRLAGKTQIYTIGDDDHKRNRLTHTLEVSQIARTISRALGLNEDLTEAIALGHDFGHTPFGHAGEEILHDIMVPKSKYVKESPFYKNTIDEINNTINREHTNAAVKIDTTNMFGFKHNLQSVRVASILEDSYRDKDNKNIGLNITNYSLWGIVNHTTSQYSNKNTVPNYQNQFVGLVKAKIKTTDNDYIFVDAWSFEAFVVREADEIAQWHHDLDDAIRGGALPINRICSTIQESLNAYLSEDDNNRLKEIGKNVLVDRSKVAELSHIVINTLIEDIVANSRNNLKEIETYYSTKYPSKDKHDISKRLYSMLPTDTIGGIRIENAIALSSRIDKEKFRNVIKQSVHHSREVERMNEKGRYIIRKLFEAYFAHPQQLPDGTILHFMVEAGKYHDIDEARGQGIGAIRAQFEAIMKNPEMIYQVILMRRICDHIACMTDRYAIDEYSNLYG